MELDPQSLLVHTLHSFTHWLKPRNLPPPAFGLIYEGAIGQPRQTHLFVTPCFKGTVRIMFLWIEVFFTSLLESEKIEAIKTNLPDRKHKMLVKKLMLLSL
jgi:hypothetical protein